MKKNRSLVIAATAVSVLSIGLYAYSTAQETRPDSSSAARSATIKRMTVKVVWGDPEKPSCTTTLSMDEGTSAKSRHYGVQSYNSYTVRVRGTSNADGTITVDIDSETYTIQNDIERVIFEAGSTITVSPNVETVIRESPRLAITASVQ
ncbi:MAG: hypothetical protein KF784_08915 [Fimbriimonadaceae bacterium]|nr:hypothetical protein [Fimbriimonadaceae bacterium]